MTTSEPFLPHPGDDDQRVAAADPGRGGPEPAPGLGVGGEEPDRGIGDAPGDGRAAESDPPFRTPRPPEVRGSEG